MSIGNTRSPPQMKISEFGAAVLSNCTKTFERVKVSGIDIHIHPASNTAVMNSFSLSNCSLSFPRKKPGNQM